MELVTDEMQTMLTSVLVADTTQSDDIGEKLESASKQIVRFSYIVCCDFSCSDGSELYEQDMTGMAGEVESGTSVRGLTMMMTMRSEFRVEVPATEMV